MCVKYWIGSYQGGYSNGNKQEKVFIGKLQIKYTHEWLKLKRLTKLNVSEDVEKL